MRRITITEIQQKKRKVRVVNENLKNQIKTILTNIDKIIKINKIQKLNKFYLNNNLNNSDKLITDTKISLIQEGLNLLDDLPFTQKLSIYEDSIFTLRKKIYSLNRNSLLEYENEIKSKTDYLQSLKNKNQNLVINNRYLNINNSEYQIKGKLQATINQFKEAKEDFIKYRNELKEKNIIIDEQNNKIYQLNICNQNVKNRIIIKKKLKQNKFNSENLKKEINEMNFKIQDINSRLNSEHKNFKNTMSYQIKKINYTETFNEELKKIIKNHQIKSKIDFNKIRKKLKYKKFNNNNNINYISNINKQEEKRSKSALLHKNVINKLLHYNDSKINGKINSPLEFPKINVKFPKSQSINYNKLFFYNSNNNSINSNSFDNNFPILYENFNKVNNKNLHHIYKRKILYKDYSDLSINYKTSITSVKKGKYNGLMNSSNNQNNNNSNFSFN